MLNFYDILDITENASAASILKAYKKRALFYHPDKNPSHRNEFSSKFRQVAEAYSILIDSRTRKKYDADLLHDRGVKLEKIEIERRQTHERCELHSYESHYGENFTNSKALALFEKVFKDADQNEECDSKVTYCNGDSPASAALNRSTPGRSQFWDRNHAQGERSPTSCAVYQFYLIKFLFITFAVLCSIRRPGVMQHQKTCIIFVCPCSISNQ